MVTKVKVLKCISSQRLKQRFIYPSVYTDPEVIDQLFNVLNLPKVLERDADASTMVVVLEEGGAIKPAAAEPETLKMVQEADTVKLDKVEEPVKSEEPVKVCEKCGKPEGECECDSEKAEPKKRGRRRKSED